MKDTALPEQGRGTEWHVLINARHGRGKTWARLGHGMLCVNLPLNALQPSDYKNTYKHFLYMSIKNFTYKNISNVKKTHFKTSI
jgi:hypothetical protein